MGNEVKEGAAEAFDLRALDVLPAAEAGVKIPILTPNGKDTGLWVRVCGKDSIRHRKALRAAMKKRLDRATGEPLSEEEQIAEDCAFLAECTIDWHIVLDGAELQCSAENARELYAQFPIVREQVDRGIADRGNFLPPVLKS